MKRKKGDEHEREPLRAPVEPEQPPRAEAPPPDAAEPAEAPKAGEALAERDDLLARLQRVSADFVNYQKRVQRDIAEAREFANAELIRELLAVLDDMERALDAARANHSADDPLLSGMHLVYGKALEVLGRFGLQPIQAEGQPFDPTRHEAMLQQPSAEHEAPTVLNELQRGYELKGRVLRPARVVVSAPAPAGDGPADDEADDEAAAEKESQ